MNLRNKKTGKVFDVIVREKSNGDGEYSTIVCNLRSLRSARSVSPILGEYDSLAKLNEEWEDYKPAEPLIKDEKIRKAVQAWAEANRVAEARYSSCHDAECEFNARDDENKSIVFIGNFAEMNEKLDSSGRTIYTIAELCGEEEECES